MVRMSKCGDRACFDYGGNYGYCIDSRSGEISRYESNVSHTTSIYDRTIRGDGNSQSYSVSSIYGQQNPSSMDERSLTIDSAQVKALGNSNAQLAQAQLHLSEANSNLVRSVQELTRTNRSLKEQVESLKRDNEVENIICHLANTEIEELKNERDQCLKKIEQQEVAERFKAFTPVIP